MSDKGTWADFMRLLILLSPGNISFLRPLLRGHLLREALLDHPQQETLPITCHLDDFLPNIRHEPGLAMYLSAGLLPIPCSLTRLEAS